MKTILTTILLILAFNSSAQLDKATHYFAGATITSTSYFILETTEMSEVKCLFLSMGIGTFAGLGKEIFDQARGGEFNMADFGFTLLGSMHIGAAIGNNINNKRKKALKL